MDAVESGVRLQRERTERERVIQQLAHENRALRASNAQLTSEVDRYRSLLGVAPIVRQL